MDQSVDGLDIYKDYREHFAETRIFCDLKSVLNSILKIHNVKNISKLLNSDEFDIQVLRSRPHIQCLERILRMQQMMKDVELMFRVHQQKAIIIEMTCESAKMYKVIDALS